MRAARCVVSTRTFTHEAFVLFSLETASSSAERADLLSSDLLPGPRPRDTSSSSEEFATERYLILRPLLLAQYMEDGAGERVDRRGENGSGGKKRGRK